ncbi:MAG: hypothetical protein BWY63_01997 [Chloroflexi bacterium ADurb.Bin360]|nr:MAG: hypothetical protein BWY63_01997 [Chloroflexi bacterium ADurb.Bin360]
MIVIGEECGILPRWVAGDDFLLCDLQCQWACIEGGFEHCFCQVEFEGEIHFIPNIGDDLLRIAPHFTHGQCIGIDVLVEDVEILEPGECAWRVLQHAIFLDQMLDGIEAEAIHAHLL